MVRAWARVRVRVRVRVEDVQQADEARPLLRVAGDGRVDLIRVRVSGQRKGPGSGLGLGPD